MVIASVTRKREPEVDWYASNVAQHIGCGLDAKLFTESLRFHLRFVD